MKRLIKGYDDGLRKNGPTNEEIAYVENKKHIMIPFYFMTGGTTFVPVESYSRVKDVKEEIFKKMELNLDRLPFYGLYEICERTDCFEERFLDEKDMIMDLMTTWEIEKCAAKLNKNFIGEPPEFKICLRMRIYYPTSDKDLDGMTMIYTQIVYDIVNSRIPLKIEDALKLAAIQLQIDFGNFKGKSERIIDNLESYIPTLIYLEKSPEQWFEAISPFYDELKGLSKKQAKLKYIDYLKSHHLHLAQQYKVKHMVRTGETRNSDLPTEFDLILAIKPKSISLIDVQNKELLSGKNGKHLHYEYSELKSWGSNADLIVLIIGGGDDQIKYYFSTDQAKEIKTILNAYNEKKDEDLVETGGSSNLHTPFNRRAVSVYPKKK